MGLCEPSDISLLNFYSEGERADIPGPKDGTHTPQLPPGHCLTVGWARGFEPGKLSMTQDYTT